MKRLWLTLLVLVLLITNGVTAFILYTKKQTTSALPTNQTTPPTNTAVNAPTNTPPDENSVVGWIAPEPVTLGLVFDEKATPTVKNIDQEKLKKFLLGASIYRVGHFADWYSAHPNGTIYRLQYDNVDCDTMGCPAYNYFIVSENQRLSLLSRYSDTLDQLSKEVVSIFSIDSTVLPNLENPQTIAIPGSRFSLIKNTESRVVTFSGSTLHFGAPAADDVPLMDAPNGKKIYRDSREQCYVIFNGNGTYDTYTIQLDFVANSQTQDANAHVLNIAFDDGTKNTADYYISARTGCGSMGCLEFSTLTDNETTPVGKTAKGDLVYVPKPGNKVFDDSFKQAYGPEGKKPTWEEFLNDRPVLLTKDPFGAYIMFRIAKYVPLAECGKPVIYLYPITTTDISVKVFPAGGLTVTEPLYDKGWEVKASPDGTLYNYGDGGTYPYLFWEGTALDYVQPREGFVVERAKVKEFLQTKLALLGLNKKEANDFMEFWLPRMQAKPYYFVTFVPQEQFESLAPLTVSPHPTTTIRVFMDYQGLTEPKVVTEQKIVTPTRSGFTVVEWGGALHE